MRKTVVINLIVLAITLFLASACLGAETGGQDMDRRTVNLSVGYDLWYADWYVMEPDAETKITYGDYNIDPTIIHGVAASISTSKRNKGSFDVSLSYHGATMGDSDAVSSEMSKYITGLVGYGASDNYKVMALGTDRGFLRQSGGLQSLQNPLDQG